MMAPVNIDDADAYQNVCLTGGGVALRISGDVIRGNFEALRDFDGTFIDAGKRNVRPSGAHQ
jgi:hypothetical protein